MKLAIIGGGIGGLTTALCLQKHGIQADLYEKTAAIRPVGAGILLAHNAMQVYHALGLSNAIEKAGNPLTALRVTTKELSPLSTIHTASHTEKYGVKGLAIARSALQNILIDHLPKNSIHLGKELVCLTTGANPALRFSDGFNAQYDGVIAADGIHSFTRNSLFPDNNIRNAKQICWRGIAAFNLPKRYAHELNEAWGNGSRFGFVQIAPNQVYWFALLNSQNHEKNDDFSTAFQDYHPLIVDILKNTDQTEIFETELTDLKPISNWVQNNVCLLGDAAHATTPNLGQGACQAIEDADVLARCLSKMPIDTAFKHYQKLRISKATMVVNMSWRIGKIAQLENPTLRRLRNFTLKHTPPSIQRKQSEKLFELAVVE